MDHQIAFSVPLDLGDVVRHIVNHLHAEFFGGRSEDCRECLSGVMRDDLAIRKRTVGRAVHRDKIVLSFWRTERGTG